MTALVAESHNQLFHRLRADVQQRVKLVKQCQHVAAQRVNIRCHIDKDVRVNQVSHPSKQECRVVNYQAAFQPSCGLHRFAHFSLFGLLLRLFLLFFHDYCAYFVIHLQRYAFLTEKPAPAWQKSRIKTVLIAFTFAVTMIPRLKDPLPTGDGSAKAHYR